LYDLKTAMGAAGDLLVSSHQEVTLSSDGLWVDAMELTDLSATTSPGNTGHFNQLERKANLYRGEFMAGFSLPDCQDFEEWLLLQRESLLRSALSWMEKLSRHHEQTGAEERALPFALRYTELDPLNEDAHCQLIRLYTRNGRTNTALRHYDKLVSLLDGELGVVPQQQTQELASRIRRSGLAGNTTNEDLYGLICALYRAVDQPHDWHAVLDRIATSMGADRFLFASRDRATVKMHDQFHWGLGDEALNDYTSHYSTVDVLSKNLEQARKGLFHSSQELYPEKKLYSTELYNDFCRPYDIRHSVDVAFDNLDSTLYSQFACFRGAGTEAFTDREMRPWDALVPHLQQCVSLRNKFLQLQSLTRSTEQLVNSFPMAAFLCQANGQLLSHNQLAENMLSTATRFTAKTGAFIFHHHRDNTRFRTMLHQAQFAAVGKAAPANNRWSLEESGTTLNFSVLPFTFRPEGLLDSVQPCALVLITAERNDSLRFAGM
jgi:tetratricopeptide (TPR) repeat protein